MKTVTKEEWDKAPETYKKVYNGVPYMVYKDTDGRIYFGPVKIVGEKKQNKKKAP